MGTNLVATPPAEKETLGRVPARPRDLRAQPPMTRGTLDAVTAPDSTLGISWASRVIPGHTQTEGVIAPSSLPRPDPCHVSSCITVCYLTTPSRLQHVKSQGRDLLSRAGGDGWGWTDPSVPSEPQEMKELCERDSGHSRGNHHFYSLTELLIKFILSSFPGKFL